MTKAELKAKKDRNNFSVQLPDGLLEELNAITKDIGKSRNQLIVKLIIKELRK